MNRIAKLLTAVQALLLAPMGVAKSADAARPDDFTEAAQWQAAISSGTPEDLQRFISQFPQGERLSEAFELIVEGEIEAAKSEPGGSLSAVQLAEARRDRLEVLEHDFDRGALRPEQDPNQDERGLAPY